MPAKVWRTLTEPELLAKWIMVNDMRPLVGHSFTFKAQPTPWWDGIVHCEVLEIELNKRRRYSWRSGPESSPLDTVVTWTLTPTPSGGTRLALEHSGFLLDNAFAFDARAKGGGTWLASVWARCWRTYECFIESGHDHFQAVVADGRALCHSAPKPL